MTDPAASRPQSATSEEFGASAEPDAAAPNATAPVTDSDLAPGQPLDQPRDTAAEALAQEAAELKDKLLRTLAEMENLRRRTEREVADVRAFGVAAFAHDMLAVADNLRRALGAIEAESRASAPPPVASLVEGIELTERELIKALEKHGVRRFDPMGEKFDPHVHQAMFEVPDPSAPAGTIVQVVQAGFMIGERVLRPALVGVAKGGPKAPPPEPAPASDKPASEQEPQGTI